MDPIGNVFADAYSTRLPDESSPVDLSPQAGKLDRLEGPVGTQVQKVRNVAAPKANEGSQAAPRMLKLTLTDGVSSVNAIELETINHVGVLSLNE